MSGTATYYLVRYLTADRRAAVVAAIGFAYCPFVFGHTPHIQLEMTAGLPLALLAFHRLADRPTIGRGLALGAVVGGQTLFCAYYGVFAVLIVSYGALVLATTRRLWTTMRYWMALLVAGAMTLLIAAPLYVPYALLRRQTGFSRTLKDAESFSAIWQMYFASAAYAHAWMLRLVGHRGEVLFPGFVTSLFGILGVVVGALDGRSRRREAAILYSTLAVLAYIASLGPSGGLYLSALCADTYIHLAPCAEPIGIDRHPCVVDSCRDRNRRDLAEIQPASVPEHCVGSHCSRRACLAHPVSNGAARRACVSSTCDAAAGPCHRNASLFREVCVCSRQVHVEFDRPLDAAR